MPFGRASLVNDSAAAGFIAPRKALLGQFGRSAETVYRSKAIFIVKPLDQSIVFGLNSCLSVSEYVTKIFHQ